ncbi:MAG: tRNA pseudouridine(55) synthase TruB [Candidatus Sumerlaeaceae bacterium]|nr:tRNA pseudouridine(55) synthase TruB [Candidatus Sumerlaeaceae bacterium]
MPRKRSHNDSGIAGVLPVLKQPGPTSHDIVDMARRALRTRQVGHTGTLDPAAGGLLTLCLGPYTKLVPYLIDNDKTYHGWIALGAESSTDDSEGEPTMVGDPSALTLERIRAAVGRFVGEIEQVPPRFSAVKIAGKKLYEYARENQKVEAEPRHVIVHRFDVDALEPAELPAPMAARRPPDAPPVTLRRVRFTARVSSGTYVRALARDLGRDLGCGGFLLSLERKSIGHVSADQAMPAEWLLSEPERAHQFMIRGAATLDPNRYPILTLLRGYERRLANGQPLNDRMMDNPTIAAAVPSGAICGIAGEGGELLAIMEAERFDAMRRVNPYDSRFDVHFRPVRIFPGGLR